MEQLSKDQRRAEFITTVQGASTDLYFVQMKVKDFPAKKKRRKRMRDLVTLAHDALAEVHKLARL